MKKFLALIVMSISLLQGMEEQSEEEKHHNKQVKLWQLLGHAEMPSLKFVLALDLAKQSYPAINDTHLPEELKTDIYALKKDLGKKLIDILRDLGTKKNNSSKNKEYIKLILNTGADFNVQNDHGDTALIWSLSLDNEEIIRFLLDAKVDVNMQGSQKSTALFHAAGDCKIEIVKLLLNAHADINRKNIDGETALIQAVRIGVLFENSETLKLLIKVGADINIQDHLHKTALHYALEDSHTCQEYENLQEIVDILLDAGASLNILYEYKTNLANARYPERNQEHIKRIIDNTLKKRRKKNEKESSCIIA